jgi:hypothetical protein
MSGGAKHQYERALENPDDSDSESVDEAVLT